MIEKKTNGQTGTFQHGGRSSLALPEWCGFSPSVLRSVFLSACLAGIYSPCIGADRAQSGFRFEDLVVPPLSSESPFQARISFNISGSEHQNAAHLVRIGTDAEYREFSLPRPEFLKNAHVRPLDPKNPAAGYLLTGAVPWDNKTFNVLFVHEGGDQKIVTNYRVVLSTSAASVQREQLEPQESAINVTGNPSVQEKLASSGSESLPTDQKSEVAKSAETLNQNQYRIQIGDTLEFILGRMVTEGRDFEEVVRAFRSLNPDVWQADGMSLRVGSVVKLPYPMRVTNPTYASRSAGGSFGGVASQRLAQVAQSTQDMGRTIPSIPERKGSLSPTIENPKGRDAVIRAIKEEIKADRGGWPQNSVAENPISDKGERSAEAPAAEQLAQADTDFQVQSESPRYVSGSNIKQSPAYVITREEIYLALLVIVALAYGYSHLRRRGGQIAQLSAPTFPPPTSPPPEYQRPPPIHEHQRDPPASSNSQRVFEAGFEAGFRSGVTAPGQMASQHNQPAAVAPTPMGGPAHYPSQTHGGMYYAAPAPAPVHYAHPSMMVQVPQPWMPPVQQASPMPMAAYGMSAPDAAGYVMTAYGPVHASQFAALNQAPMAHGTQAVHTNIASNPGVPEFHQAASQTAPVQASAPGHVQQNPIRPESPPPVQQEPIRAQETRVASMMQQPQHSPVKTAEQAPPGPQPIIEPMPVPPQAPEMTTMASSATPHPAQPMAEMAGAAKEASKKRNARDERLDLARVYINMGDRETAKLLLRQIIDAGKPADKEEAFKIFEKINASNFPKNMGVGEEVN
ncbi:MAG: hypothetical protein RLZZ627_1571 [Pseudomonadota bacterium]|jgi:FimV-like protein